MVILANPDYAITTSTVTVQVHTQNQPEGLRVALNMKPKA